MKAKSERQPLRFFCWFRAQEEAELFARDIWINQRRLFWKKPQIVSGSITDHQHFEVWLAHANAEPIHQTAAFYSGWLCGRRVLSDSKYSSHSKN